MGSAIKKRSLNLKLLSLYIVSLTLLVLITNAAYISEIKFNNDEFVEIYSNSSINLSDARVYDDNGESKFNTLSLIKKDLNSNLILIVGSNFLDINNISDFNCSIYLTSSTQVSKGGLKTNGEELLIEYNSNNSYFSFNEDSEFDFNDSQSLNFYENGSYIIDRESPCNLGSPKNYENNENNETQNNLDEDNNDNQNYFNNTLNQSKNNTVNENSPSQDFYCNYSFSIVPILNLTHEKVQFKFKTNVTQNFIIEYWIEDFKKNIVKNKFNSSNTNLKIYTPSLNKAEIFYIKSNIYFEACDVLNDSKEIFYYPLNQKDNSNNNNDNSNNNNNKNQDIENKIIIENKDDLVKKQSETLHYKFSNGENSEETIKFYLNDIEFFSIKLEELSKIEGKINLNLNSLKKNTIKISGLELEKILTIPKNSIGDSNTTDESITNETSDDQVDWINDAPSFYFNLSFNKFDLNLNKIYFNISYPLNYDFLTTSNCKVLQGRSVISNINSKIGFGKHNLTFNKNISDVSFKNVKINCRVDPSWRATPIYFDLDLSYVNKSILNGFNNLNDTKSTIIGITSFVDNTTVENLSNKNNTNFESNFSSLDSFANFSYQNNRDFREFTNLNKNKILNNEEIQNYESKQSTYKQKAFFGLFVGSLILVIGLIFYM